MSKTKQLPATDRPTSILDQRFKYTSSTATDLAKKFRAIRRELKAREEPASPDNVKHIRRVI